MEKLQAGSGGFLRNPNPNEKFSPYMAANSLIPLYYLNHGRPSNKTAIDYGETAINKLINSKQSRKRKAYTGANNTMLNNG